jgi:hypothetical protein
MKLACIPVAALLLAACSSGSGGSSGGGGGTDNLVLSGYTSAGCTNATTSFLSTYTGTFADGAMTTSMTIGGSGSLSLTETRQVGGTISGVPYPTTCTYDNQGELLAVFSAGSSAQCQSLVGADATDIMVFSVSQLTISAPVSANCQTFASAMNMRASSGGLIYSVAVKLIDANTFQFEDNGSGPSAGEKMVRK